MWQDDGMGLGTRLREAREARGLTREALREIIGSAGGAITRWERGYRAPTADYVSRLARALGVTERWLVTGEGSREATAGQALDVPVGLAALESVLYTCQWPDLPIHDVDAIVARCRADADTPEGRLRPASAWKLLVAQLVRDAQALKATATRRVR